MTIDNDEIRHYNNDTIRRYYVFPGIREDFLELSEDFLELSEDSLSAWIGNIFAVGHYYLENIIIVIESENHEIIECTADEICSQSKMKEKMEEKFQVALPMLDEFEYVIFTDNIMRCAFCKE